MRASSVLPDESPEDNHEDAIPLALRWRIGDAFRVKGNGRVRVFRVTATKPLTWVAEAGS